MLEDSLAERINLALQYVLPSHPAGSEIESADAGEERGVTPIRSGGNCNLGIDKYGDHGDGLGA